MDVCDLNREGWDRFGWRPVTCEGIILAERLHDWGRWAVPFFFQFTLAFASTEDLSQGSCLVLDTTCY